MILHRPVNSTVLRFFLCHNAFVYSFYFTVECGASSAFNKMETSEEISNATKSDASNSTENVGLDSLNDHCLLQLFNYLPLKDARNLAETSKRFKLLFMMFRYRKFLFEFHCDMFTKICKNGKRVIENILLEYGPNLRSWSLTVDGSDSGVEILKTISAFSKNLTRLELTGLPDAFGDCGEALGCFENVEALIFIDCGVVPLTFLKRFRNLKHLKFEGRSGTTIKDLQIVFENNPNIESYSIRDLHYLSVDGGVDLLDFDRTDIARFGSELNLLKCGPKFHMLDLGSLHYDCLKMDDMLLLAATNLTKLKLDCLTKNATVFLTELAKRNTLKELDICGLAGVVNQELCNVIQSFRKLELLKFGTSAELGPPFVWPPNLRRLCLTSPVTGPIFLRIVRRLKYLTHLQLTTIPNSEVCFRALYETFMENGTRIIRRPNLHIFYDWFTRPRETPSQV